MKTLLRLWLGWVLVAGVASASAELSSVPFVIGHQRFKAGDVIVIDQVLATTPKLGVGDRVVVRGHYQLASASKATLGLFVAHSSPSAAPDAVVPTQTTLVESAAGKFELSCGVTYTGSLHVSFYPVPRGEAFGGVYFQQK